MSEEVRLLDSLGTVLWSQVIGPGEEHWYEAIHPMRVKRVEVTPRSTGHQPPADEDGREMYDTGWSDALAWGWWQMARRAGWTPPEGWREPQAREAKAAASENR